ncbi:MAG: aminoglycoside phosphotransferase family protein [Anaerolineae bacterium]|nr:aminoglycoside phosphotransferase family protein [Anaerolineae bacterium]
MIQAEQVIQAANLQEIYPLERLEGHERAKYNAHEVWGYGGYVLRIHPQGDLLADENRVLRLLPSSIPHAAVVAAGDGWLVQRRVPGEPLSAVWRSLTEPKRRAAAQQLAAILINLHQMRVSGMPSLSPGWFAALLPADIFKLSAQARDLDPPLMDAINDFVRRTMSDVKPPLRWGFVHRDLHFAHVLWNGERITALLDFGSTVLAPRELELDALLRFARYPERDSNLQAHDLARLPGWLHEDYPLLFSEPGIEQRLRLYSIEHDLRQLADRPDPAALERLRATIA